MVFYYTSNATHPPTMIYVGKDKYENEDLIKYGWPEDIWFHVDKLSSAHVYLRMEPGMQWDNLPAGLIEDCAQLVKANSIQGCKMSSVDVVYTPWANLKKTGDMDIGQVSFHNQKQVKKISVDKKNEFVNRLNKTKKEDYPDLAAERQKRDRREIENNKKAQKEKIAQSKEEMQRKKKEMEEQSYAGMFDESKMHSNQYDHDVDVRAFEEDFM
eukprot:comp8452_c0_seq1/m.3799 comp8452_c0_seq1/g.3799  ORF comp8452_c0_seq1/g.3799 comp8452_c0_seq1/m.3799 type:complete len:213 (-) comp8452_c0_seq1:396-1034(-)